MLDEIGLFIVVLNSKFYFDIFGYEIGVVSW